MRGLMQQRPLTVRELAERAEQNFAHKNVVTATASGETTATWREVGERARRLAGALELLDVPPAARVGTLAWNTQRHAELYIAVPAGGRVLHTLNHRLHPDELRYIVADAADDVLFVDRSLLPKLGALMTELATVRHIVVMDDGGNELIPDDPRIVDYEQLLGSGAAVADWPGLDEDDAASLCYTSGTTGRPKGVLYSHRSIALHALMLLGVDGFAISERDVVMPIVPMFHVNAWGLPYAAMLAGSTLVLPGPAMSAGALLRQLERHRVTFAAGVPTVWRGIQPLLADADLTGLRMAVSGGGALPNALSRAWEQAVGVPLTSSWGMTETSPLVCCSRVDSAHAHLPADDRRLLLGVPGPNMPFTRLRILDGNGRPVAHDGVTPGELQAAGPTIAAGYFGDESRAAFTEDGWLRTGDVATIDRFGYLRIVDRTKDLVKSGGEWISSVALENEIMAHPSVREAAVIAVADERWGERPLACVVPVAGHTIDPDELREFLKARVSSWWVPEQVWVLAQIPKTSTGKFSKLALRAQRAEFDAATSTSSTTSKEGRPG